MLVLEVILTYLAGVRQKVASLVPPWGHEGTKLVREGPNARQILGQRNSLQFLVGDPHCDWKGAPTMLICAAPKVGTMTSRSRGVI